MHPLEIFHYCPRCGSSNFNIDTDRSKKCADCGFEHFQSPSISAACFIFDDQDRLVCIRRAKEPSKGLLAVPGGFVDLNETIEEAAIREVREETGLIVEIKELLCNIPNTYIYSDKEQYPLDFYFSAQIIDDSHVHAQEGEVTDIVFVPRAEINVNDFAMRSTRELLKKLGIGN